MSRFRLPLVAFATRLLALAFAPIGGLAVAQDVLLDVKSPVAGAHASVGIAIGDWDGDGVGDLAIGAAWDHTVASNAGAVRIHSGKNGSILATFYGAAAGDIFGWSVARMPDLDGDGIDDLAVGAPGTVVSGTTTGSVYLYSGRAGTLQRRIDSSSNGCCYGEHLGPMGDVDGDGISDLYVGHSGAGEVQVDSGADGHEITKIVGSINDYFGYAACAVDDLDGDGVRDLLIGAKHHVIHGFVEGAAYVYSGATGALLRKHDGTYDDLFFGYDTAALTDLDGDGVNDYAISVWDYFPSHSCAVYVFSGATGTQLTVLTPTVTNWSYFLTQVVAAGDVNGDGVGDIAIEGDWIDAFGGGGAVFLISGKTFLCLDRIETRVLGLSLAPFGDLNGDGLDDLIVGGTDSSIDGEVFVYSGDDLWLNTTPSSPPKFEMVEFDTREGVTGAPTILVLEAIDGTPTFQIVDGVKKFGPQGGAEFFGKVPPGLAGHDFTFRAYADNASGRVITSAAQILSCQ